MGFFGDIRRITRFAEELTGKPVRAPADMVHIGKGVYVPRSKTLPTLARQLQKANEARVRVRNELERLQRIADDIENA